MKNFLNLILFVLTLFCAQNATYGQAKKIIQWIDSSGYAVTSPPRAIGVSVVVTNGVYTNAANSMSVINPMTTLAESWIGPSSTTGVYFKNGFAGFGTTNPQGVIDLGLGTNGRSICWGGSSGTTMYASIGTSYSSANLYLLNDLKLSTSTTDVITSIASRKRAGIAIGRGSTADLVFFNNDADALAVGGTYNVDSNTRMIIKSTSGYIGVNTLSPVSRFDVSGSIEASDRTVLGGELVTNGTFTTDSSGWSVVSCTIDTHVTNIGKLTETQTTTGTFGVRQSFAVKVGRTYVVSATMYGTLSVNITSSNLKLGTTAGGSQYAALAFGTGVDSTSSYEFVATTTTLYIQPCGVLSGTNGVCVWDNISVKEVIGGNVKASGRFTGGGSLGLAIDCLGNGVIDGTFSFASSSLPATTISFTNGAAAATGTLTNAPVSGNPTKWIPINDNGTTRYIPAW